MTRKKIAAAAIVAVLGLGAIVGVLYASPGSDDGLTLARLARETHFHGIAVDPNNADRLYLATHNGVFVAGPDGKATQISKSRDDFMGFTPHPSDSSVLYASGHPERGGNLGFIVSKDGGKSWSKLSDGVGGPVDFHQMDVSKADPRVIYGDHGGLQKSVDGGRTWRQLGVALRGLIDLAASSRDPDMLYAATRQGLLRSTDGGKSWQAVYSAGQPATMVYVTQGGEVYAFIYGTGLVRATEPDLRWQVLSSRFGRNVILHFAVGRSDPRRIYAALLYPEARTQSILMSRDGGTTWAKLGVE